MAMTSTFFVDLDEQWRPQGVAPTEHDDRRGLVCGEVHDENAHAAGGICGHAGLFAPAGDVARFAGAMCSTAAGTPTAGFDPATVRAFFDTPPVGGSNWRLGWDTPSASLSHAGDLWPRTGVGHLAFTGCSMWLDPPRERYVVLLTNRVHPTRQQGGIRDLRRQVMDTVAATWNMTR